MTICFGATILVAERLIGHHLAGPLAHNDADHDNAVSFSSHAGHVRRRIAVEIPT
jgi:hypothetical protein